MLTKGTEWTDMVSADRLARSSGLLLGEEFQAMAAATMHEIQKQEKWNYIVAPGLGSSPTDESAEAMSHTSRTKREGLLPEFRPARLERSTDRFVPLQKWEGVVLDIQGGTFIARLVDLTRSNPAEDAELPVDEVSAADHDLMKPGAIFYWTIGYLDDRYGQRQRASRIRFRRLPAWTDEEIKSARREADAIAERLGWK